VRAGATYQGRARGHRLYVGGGRREPPGNRAALPAGLAVLGQCGRRLLERPPAAATLGRGCTFLTVATGSVLRQSCASPPRFQADLGGLDRITSRQASRVRSRS